MVRDHRRLAAIVSLDVAGYSRLMGVDESGTLAALKAHRRELIDPKIAEHDGRIGINVGDIIIDGDDIFGDGVNVAARLEALAEPGGICVSRNVRDQVLDKLSFAFEDLGAQEVKNIARPVDVYRVSLDAEASARVISKPVQRPQSPSRRQHR